MQVDIEQRDRVSIVRVVGSVDALTADALTASLAGELRSGRACLVADFSGVEYTSSAGLRVLLATLKEARQAGGDLRLAAVREAIRGVLDLSGFSSIIRTFPDLTAAIASYDG